MRVIELIKTATIGRLVFFAVISVSASGCSTDAVLALAKERDPVVKACFDKSIIQGVKLGDSAAQTMLATHYLQGDCIEKDADMALIWFRRAAQAGNFAAMTQLGVIYDEGQYVPEDSTESWKWIYKAASGGYAEAQAIIGSWYAYGGHGIPENQEEARFWLSKAALQGNRNAAVLLAYLSNLPR